MPSADPAAPSDAAAQPSSSAFASPTSVRWRLRAQRRFDSFRWTPLTSALAAASLLLLYAIATAFAGSRQLWSDELRTYYIAQAPSLPQLFRELELDLNPPLEYLAVRASLALFGDHSYAVRLPSILAFLVGTVCFYRFVAKRAQRVYGLLAVLAFWSTPFFLYATEARPYALVVGWFGLAMLAWDGTGPIRTGPTHRSKAAVLWLALAITGMMASHIFSLIYIAPFCLAEAWRLYRTRRFDWPVWLALLLPAAIPLTFLKLMARFESSLFPSIFEASPRKLGAFYYHTLLPETPALLFAAAVALLLGFQSQRMRSRTARPTPIDIAFTAGLLAMPEIVILLLMKTHGAFFPRYAILSAFGYALLLVFTLVYFTNSSRLAATAACGILFLYDAGAIPSAYYVHQVEQDWPPKQAALELVRPDLPLVAASGLTFLEMDKYEHSNTVHRLYYLEDRALAIQYAHATMFQEFPTLKRYFPIRGTVEQYRPFVTEHPTFLVLGSPEYPEDWLLRCLYDQHATVHFLGYFGGPYKDYQLFQVTVPAHPAP